MVRTEEFLLQTGLSQETFQDVLALGWVESEKDEDDNPVFSDADIYRVRKLLRICSDFELPVVGGTIIVDLLERVAALEDMVRQLQAERM